METDLAESTPPPVADDAGTPPAPDGVRAERDRTLRRLHTVFLLSWLLPTLGTDGKPDEARINALGKVLQPRVRR